MKKAGNGTIDETKARGKAAEREGMP